VKIYNARYIRKLAMQGIARWRRKRSRAAYMKAYRQRKKQLEDRAREDNRFYLDNYRQSSTDSEGTEVAVPPVLVKRRRRAPKFEKCTDEHIDLLKRRQIKLKAKNKASKITFD
jgi:hypothetical protein